MTDSKLDSLAAVLLVHSYVNRAPPFRCRHADRAGRLRLGQGNFTGLYPPRSAAQTIVAGGLAAGVAYMIARLISGIGG